MKTPPPERDLGKLVPEFRARVESLLRRMHAAGHDAIVWEAWRSISRAEELQKRGTGVAKSMHCYGLAADIISKRKLWDPPTAFWAELRQGCADLGLTWGGGFSRVDKPHCQALPAGFDNRVRAATPTQIEALVAAHFDRFDFESAHAQTVPDSKPGGA